MIFSKSFHRLQCQLSLFSYNLNDSVTRIYQLDPHKELSRFARLVDFPSDIANKSLSESSATMLWKSKGRRRRTSHPTAESSSEQGASEADIDSDSGYCSPKHGTNQPTAGALRNPDSGTMNVCVTLLCLISELRQYSCVLC